MVNSIAAIVVTYNPCPNGLENLLSMLAVQAHCVLVVDNGSDEDLDTRLDLFKSSVEVMRLGENRGIAYAQNKGIHWAFSKGVENLIFFDQDSLPTSNMVATLLRQLKALQMAGKMVACIGPSFIDVRKQLQGNLNDVSAIQHVDTLISSGSVIPVQVLAAVGGMVDELFIDYVDLEWCLRARSLGYCSYQSQQAVMYHTLGDEWIMFFGSRWPSRSPLRHYYMSRNAVWMYKNSSASFGWKLVDFLKLIRKIIFYSLFAKPRTAHIKMMSQGLWHGLIGKMGKHSS